MAVSKDKKYYRSDGDCIIQVEDILFKIHRYHLTEDSSVFENMFSLPSGTLSSEGQADDNPVVLQGDTLVQFRAFLSFVYSNPSQLQINRTSADDVERLLNMIPFAHKYLLQNCLLWALESLEHVLDSAATIPDSQYLMIWQAATLCTSLHAATCDHICDRLKRKWITHIKADPLRIVPAIDLAETLDFKTFLVDLYYVVLETLAASDDPGRAMIEGPLAGISAIHQLRIFSGPWFVAHAYKEFVKTPPAINHLPTCPTNSGCRTYFPHFWNQFGPQQGSWGLDNGSPVSILQKAEDFKTTVAQSMVGYATSGCPLEAEMDVAIAAFKTSLTNLFFALPPANVATT
ncbi:hypothetical protein B0H19DRAFT_178635 [Mycena capillaripes]|nr:hypothetical protein B0H19DRAFT_178635 [Mycena capillaripes]